MHDKDIKTPALQTVSDASLEGVAGGYAAGTVASGSFTSQTGTGLNLLVSWSAATDGFGRKTLYVTVSSTSYSLYSCAMPNGVELTVNGITYIGASNAVNYGGGAMTSHVLASFTLNNVVSPASITAAWHFNGSYSGVALNTIRASGVASF